MKPFSIEQVKATLGAWPDNSLPGSISVTLDRTDTNLAYFISDRINNVKIFHRPNGLQLINTGIEDSRRNFCLLFSNIKLVEFFPERRISVRGRADLLSTLVSTFLFSFLGYGFAGEQGAVIWLPCGIIFGLLVSANFNSYSRVCMIRITLENGHYLLFSCKAGEAESARAFFKNAIRESLEIY